MLFAYMGVALLGFSAPAVSTAQPSQQQPETFGTYTPNRGFRLATTDKGTVNFRIFAYLRYLNQGGLDSIYIDSFGDTTAIDRRQDFQVNKVNIQFNGWLLDPKFTYLFYVWTNNTAQGQTSQVVVAGNLQYSFSKHLTLGGGINALPGVRSTEGNFPFWLSVDNRLAADEFFRPSYTSGIWARGVIADGLQYNMMLGNNLSQLGIDAGQLDFKFNTFSVALSWFPTTGEYGLNSSYGDFEHHEKVATRIGAHYSRSDEDRQGVPASEAFENVTLRLSDGSVIFRSDLLGPGIQINQANYQMFSFDAGAKWRGFALEGEYYIRRIDNLRGLGIDQLAFDAFSDTGFQLQASGMVVDQTLQAYATYARINGEYGNPWDLRFGVNWFPWKNQVVRWNLEYIQMKHIPVGGLSLPFPVGGTGGTVYSNFMVNF
jgi:hypothetical protein